MLKMIPKRNLRIILIKTQRGDIVKYFFYQQNLISLSTKKKPHNISVYFYLFI